VLPAGLRVSRGMWTRGSGPAVVGDEDENALLFRGERAGTGVSPDSLRRQEVLDLLTEHGYITLFLYKRVRIW